MNTNLYLHSFTPVMPLHHLSQEKTVDWILKAHEQTARLSGEPWDERMTSVLKRFSLDEKFISQRWFECDEIDTDWDQHSVYRLIEGSPRGATIGVRNQFFAQKTGRVFRELYQEQTPSHVVHVSCTGYVSPSPVQVFFSELGKAVSVTHAYHMGCYASLPAIRMGMGLALLEKKSIDIVHTELCSLHLNSAVHTPEQIVVQTLFADGHIRYRVDTEKQSGFKVLTIKEQLVPGTLNDMTWVPDAFGMDMTLSRDVPAKIRDALPDFLLALFQEAKLDPTTLKDCLFAIHPGGPKIISSVQEKLSLIPGQVELSVKVLRERGNMSSATLPHVWDEMLKAKPEAGTPVISLAFGPGLTIFGAVFEVVA